MPNYDAGEIFKHFAGAFRFGRGLLGRSSIALGCLFALAAICVFRIQNQYLTASIFFVAAILFVFWYLRVERFAKENPLQALLEGGEYTAHHRMLIAAAKNQPSASIDAASRIHTIGAMPTELPLEGGVKDE